MVRPVLFLLVLVVVSASSAAAGPTPEERTITIEGRLGPYWEQRDLHVGGPSFEGSVALRNNESTARAHLTIEDRAAGVSAGYLVLFCPEPCGMNHDGPTVARATGMGPFDLEFSVRGIEVLHYRIEPDEGVRVEAHVLGSLVLSGGDGQTQDSEASAPTLRHPSDPSPSPLLVALGVMGTVLVAPALAPRLHRWLAATPLAGLFTRREDLLDHPVRRRIHRTIRENPGIHVRELRRELSLPPGQVDHHLQKLVQGGYVVTHAARGYTAHFVPGAVGRDLMAALARVKSDAGRTLLSIVAEGDCLTLGLAAERMGTAISTASYHMGSLERLGLVEVRENGHQRWRVTPLGRAFLELVERTPRSGSRTGPESA